MSLRTVGLVAGKELRESLRDRRTLFVALVLPVLLYPFMMLALLPLVNLQRQRLKEEVQPIAVTGPGAEGLGRLVFEAGEDGGKAAAPALRVVGSGDPRTDLAEGRIALWVETTGDFDEALLSERSARVIVHRDGSEDRSLAAQKKFEDALRAVEDREIERRAAARGLSPEWRNPVRVEQDDVASPERRAAYLFGKILAFVLVVLTVSSSFYPAVDSVAGEKERGTMETLLVAPCGRSELVLGKFLAVLTVTLAAAILNLVSMGLTLGPLMGVVASDTTVGLRVTPTVLLGILTLLVPLGALFSAVSLALSTLARSAKEGQHYLSPLFLVVMPLAMVVMLPNVPLTAALAPVPVTNAVLFFRDLLLDKTEAGTTAIVMASTFAYAAAALWACVSLFLREETLFRGPEGSTALLVRPAPRERPGGAAALLLFAVCMALVWYGQNWLPRGIVSHVLATQLAVILAPCLLFAWWLRVRPASTFLLRRPPARALAAAVLLGLALPVLNAALHEWFGVEVPEGPMREFGQEIERLVRANAIGAMLLVGVLPAFCEELFFRGFVLSGLTSAFRGGAARARAVLLTAALFALFHLMPERWAPTFLIGLVLGLLAVRTGSIWPAMLAHAVNNSSALLHEWAPVRELAADVPLGAAVAAAALLLFAGVAMLLLTPPREPGQT